MKKGSKEETMSLWSKFLKPIFLKENGGEKSQRGCGCGKGCGHGQGRGDRGNCDNNERSYQFTRGYERGRGRDNILEEQMKLGMINLTLNVSIAISMIIFYGSVKPILNAIITISMVILHGGVKPILNVIIVISIVIFLGSVNPMLKKKSILLIRNKKMKSQHYC